MKLVFELGLTEMRAVKGGFDLEDYAGTYRETKKKEDEEKDKDTQESQQQTTP